MTTSTYKVPIKFWQNIDQKIFKVEFWELCKGGVIRSYNKTFFQKVSKIFIWIEFDKVFNFEKFLIYAFQNLIENLYVLVIICIS